MLAVHQTKFDNSFVHLTSIWLSCKYLHVLVTKFARSKAQKNGSEVKVLLREITETNAQPWLWASRAFSQGTSPAKNSKNTNGVELFVSNDIKILGLFVFV